MNGPEREMLYHHTTFRDISHLENKLVKARESQSDGACMFQDMTQLR